MNSIAVHKTWDIHGGIHPAENKHQSSQSDIIDAGIPSELVFPLSQHIGTPATVIVEVGQKVLKGQKIAEAKGFVSVPVHASTSGEVIAIENRAIPHPSSMTGLCIVIKPDGQDQWIEHSGINSYLRADKSELLAKIRESGIAGMGGAGFPSAVKLAVNDQLHIETLIINGTECEPYITSDDRLMRERADQIIEGVKILQYLINPSKETLIGVEDNKPEAIAALQKAAADTHIQIVSFPTKYPSGGEKQLIQILTGKEVPSGGLPAQVGIVCQNIGTTVAIYKAIKWGEPLISRITTVTGNACKLQQNFEVLLGSPINHLLTLCEFEQKNNSRLIMGGPMMGFTLSSTDIPVVKTTNCILAPTPQELAPPEPAQACIRCGLCAEACPASLLPQQLYWFARGKEYEKLEAHNLMDCIECGACSYACPSNIPLVQYYRASKADIRQQKQDAVQAEQSKARFEARKERIERQDAEKDAKRKARKAAAEARAAKGAVKGDNTDAIQAAIDRAKAKKAAIDPATLAIKKAKAKHENNTVATTDKASIEQALAKIEKRLATAQEKYQQAQQKNDHKLDAFRIGVEKIQAKYDQAKLQLEQLIDNAAENNTTDEEKPANSYQSNQSDSNGGAAQDAIARALAKRDVASSMTDLQRLENAVASISKRLNKAKQKLVEAKGSDTETILTDTVAKFTEKLADANQALADYQRQQQ